MKEIHYEFIAKTWKFEGKGAWVFISLPESISNEIKYHFKALEEGWGRLSVQAKVGKTSWNTAIWFDSKSKTYLLPLKSKIRAIENIKLDTELDVELTIIQP